MKIFDEQVKLKIRGERAIKNFRNKIRKYFYFFIYIIYTRKH